MSASPSNKTARHNFVRRIAGSLSLLAACLFGAVALVGLLGLGYIYVHLGRPTDLAPAAVEALRVETQRAVLVAMALLLATCTLCFWTVRQRIIQPLEWITFTFSKLVEGDLNYDVYEAGRTDEIGVLGVTYRKFRLIAKERAEAQKTAERQASIIEAGKQKAETDRAAVMAEQSAIIDFLAKALSRIAAQDLSFRLTDNLPVAYERIRDDYNRALQTLEAAMTRVIAGANAILSSTGEIAAAADDLSRRTEQQSASLEESNAALQEVMTTVTRNAANAKQAKDIVASTKTEAQNSGMIVQQATDAMARIEKSSSDIGRIIGVIDEIAFQTNLLALNAGVEAARAGDAGKGFAVVASEVRALAQRSTEAAKEIKSLVSASGSEVAEGVKLVISTGKILENIVTQVVSIDAMVSHIAVGAEEQSLALQQVNIAIGQMDQDTQKNAAMVEETTAASHSLREEAQELTRSVGEFKISEASRQQMKGASPAQRTPRPAQTHSPRVALKNLPGSGGGAAVRRTMSDVAEDAWEEF